MKDKEKSSFYTLMIVPEKGTNVKKLILPAWLVRTGLILFFACVVLATVLILDYSTILGRITTNHKLELENRRMRQQIQVFKNKMDTLETTMDRIKVFTSRLKVITNVEDQGEFAQSLQDNLPDASTNIGTSYEPPKNEESINSLLENHLQGMHEQYRELSKDSLLVEEEVQTMYEILVDQKSFLAALPTRRPVIGYITSGFGVRRSPFGGAAKMHEGIDIANRAGTPIKSTADGEVIFSDSRAGYGRTVVVDHGYGLQTWYAHNRQLNVKKGQKIKRGQIIAFLGDTGRSTAPHLHYEVRVNGTPVDPLTYILED